MMTRSRSATYGDNMHYLVDETKSEKNKKRIEKMKKKESKKPYAKSLADDLSSNDPNKVLNATKEFGKLAAINELAAEFIVEDGLFDKFTEFLREPNLQSEAASVLMHTITQTPSMMDDRRVKILLDLLDIPGNFDYQKQVVSALGCVASTCRGRELVHKHDALRILLSKNIGFNLECPLSLLKTATSALLRFCKSEILTDLVEEIERPLQKKPKRKRKGKGEGEDEDDGVTTHFFRRVGDCKAPHLDKVKAALPALCCILKTSDNVDVLTDVCSVLSCLTRSYLGENYTPVDLEPDTCKRLVGLLNDHSNDSRSFGAPALSLIANIAGRDKQSKLLLELDVTRCLLSLLQKRKDEMEVCKVIICLTNGEGRQREIKAIMTRNLIDPLLELVVAGRKNSRIRDIEDLGAMAGIAISNCLTGCAEDDISGLRELIGEDHLRLFSLL